MRILNIFFPANARPRTVIHAGSLLMKRTGGIRALRRYLRLPRTRDEVFLLHQGQEPLREVAKKTDVQVITLDTTSRQEANAASEMALALGAQRLDFTIDEPCLTGANGEPLHVIAMSEADRLARDPDVRPRIRTKLRAGCEAIENGMQRVRIGNPESLALDDATTFVPDGSMPVERRKEPQEDSAMEWRRIDPSPPLVALGRRREARRSPNPAREPRHEIGVRAHVPRTALRDAWWRLRGLRTSRSPEPLECGAA